MLRIPVIDLVCPPVMYCPVRCATYIYGVPLYRSTCLRRCTDRGLLSCLLPWLLARRWGVNLRVRARVGVFRLLS